MIGAEEVGLAEYSFQPDTFELKSLARRGPINNPAWVRKGYRYPRTVWQMRPRAEPGRRDAGQCNARRAWRWRRCPLRRAARSDGVAVP